MSETLTLPLFPLPGLVFFPETLLPLHVFEPRYRELLADVLAGDGVIGMATVDLSAGSPGAAPPPLLPLGCAGEIVESRPLPDGRSDIVLRGVFRYRLEAELPSGRAYRLARARPLPVQPLPERLQGRPGRRELRRLLAREVERLAVSVGRPSASRLPSVLGDEALLAEAADRLGLGSAECYALLAMDRLEERYLWVLEHVRGLSRRIELLAPFRRSHGDPRDN